jgi:hypothetical protein
MDLVFVCSEISGEELVEGIDRVSRNRGYGNLPPTPIILDLLQQAGTIKQTRPGYFTGNAGEIDSPLKIFIVNAIKDSLLDFIKDAFLKIFT